MRYLFLLILISSCHLRNKNLQDNIEIINMISEYNSELHNSLLSRSDKRENNLVRKNKLYKLFKNKKVKTSNDFYNVALILQDCTDTFSSKIAIISILAATEMNLKLDKWNIAYAYDHDLILKNQPQIYGTHILTSKGIDLNKTTDKERIKYNVGTKQDWMESIRLNKLTSLQSLYLEHKNIKETLDFIIVETRKGKHSKYNVCEWEINRISIDIFERKNENYEAYPLFKLNTTLYPKSYKAHQNFGYYLLKSYRIQEGIEELKLSFKLKPNNYEVFDVLNILTNQPNNFDININPPNNFDIDDIKFNLNPY